MANLSNTFVARSFNEAEPSWFCVRGLPDELAEAVKVSSVGRDWMSINVDECRFFSKPFKGVTGNQTEALLMCWLLQTSAVLRQQISVLGACIIGPIVRSHIQRQQVSMWRQLLSEDYALVIRQRPEVNPADVWRALMSLNEEKHDHFNVEQSILSENINTLEKTVFMIGAHELWQFLQANAPCLSDRVKLLIPSKMHKSDWAPLIEYSFIWEVITPWMDVCANALSKKEAAT